MCFFLVGNYLRPFNINAVVLILLFVCFVALHPNSTAMVIAGRSVHLNTLLLGRLEQAVNQ